MVPVPEELAPKVLDYVNWKGHPGVAGPPQPENDAAGPSRQAAGDAAAHAEAGGGPIPRGFARLDDAGRALVAVVATAALDGEQLTVPEAARRAGLGTREALGTILELNNVIAGEGGPPIAIFVKDLEDAASTEFSWGNRIVLMPEPTARPLAELARAHAER